MKNFNGQGIQHPDKRIKDSFKSIKRIGNQQNKGFGFLDSQRFRYQLAVDNVQQRDKAESNTETNLREQDFIFG